MLVVDCDVENAEYHVEAVSLVLDALSLDNRDPLSQNMTLI